jgi:electron transport complex protein RnfE
MKDRGLAGIVNKNPVAVTLIGLCPAAAVTTRVIDALWLSVGVFSVLVLSSTCMSLIGRWANRDSSGGASSSLSPLRWLGAIALASSLAACFDILLAAFSPGASARLGIYAPLIAVNCLVLGSAETRRRRTPVGRAMLEAAGLALGFAISLALIAVFREALGSGTITLFPIGAFGGTLPVPSFSKAPARALLLAGGGLLCLGYLSGLARVISDGRARAESSRKERSDK